MDTNRLVLQLTKDSSISLCVLETFDNDFKLFNSAYDTSNNLKMKDYCYMNAGNKFVTYSNQIRSSQLTVYINYFYNSAGERVKKLTRKGSKIEVTIHLDGGMFEISYSKTLEGTIDSNRYYNTLKISDASTSLSTGGSLIATIRVGKNVDDTTPPVKYILGDHLNNSTVTLDESGLLVNREEYYPFGETSFGGFAYKRYRYNGKEKDSESGLYEYGQRYYAPWLCRFVSVDPIAESYPQLSSYNYAGNKPITSPDIEGLQGTEDKPMKTSESTSSKSDDNGFINVEVHQVKKGETISGLAKEYGVSQDAIKRANPQTQQRSKEDQINIGENIVIPLDILPDNSLRQRDPEGLEYIPFDSDYQKNLELQTESPKPTPVDDTSFQEVLSDIWNSPVVRLIVPDKMTISLSSSVTAIFGTYTGLDFNWITRGHDASLIPYPTFAVGGQMGTKVSANALVGAGRGYFLTSDVRKLEEKEAARALLGTNVEVTGGIGVIAGGEGFLSLGISMGKIRTVDYGISGGYSIGGGLSGGVNYTIPILPSQFTK